MKKEQISYEVQQTLDLLENPEQIECSPYFKSRLLRRIRDEEQKQVVGIFRKLFGDYLQPVVLTVLLCANLYAGAVFYQTFGPIDQNAMQYSQLEEDEMVSQYSVSNYIYSEF